MYRIIIASILDFFDRRNVVLGIATSDDDIERIVDAAKKKYSAVTIKKIIKINNLNEFIPHSTNTRIEL